MRQALARSPGGDDVSPIKRRSRATPRRFTEIERFTAVSLAAIGDRSSASVAAKEGTAALASCRSRNVTSQRTRCGSPREQLIV